jgi:quinol monooxygenase YgiN
MYTRIVEVTLKPGKLDEARTMMNREIAPALRTQTGFVDGLSLVSDTDPNTLLSITMWHTKAEADRYNTANFPKLIGMLEPLLTRYTVKTFNVENSSFHKIAAGRAA